MPPSLRILAPGLLLVLMAACATRSPVDSGRSPASGAVLAHMHIGRRARSYWLYAPGANEAERPLLVVLHGTGSDGAGLIKLGNFATKADTTGFLLAAPNSLGRAFNDGSNREGPGAGEPNDVAFIAGMIDAIRARYTVSRVYVTGFGSGGAMAQRLALEIPDKLDGVASIAGHLWKGRPPNQPGDSLRPVPMLLLFGTEDPFNPITGGPVRYGDKLVLDKPSPMQTAAYWAKLYGCSTTISATARMIHQITWYGCRANVPVMLLAISGLGHYWPGGNVPPPTDLSRMALGPYINNVRATDIVWDFFTRIIKRDRT